MDPGLIVLCLFWEGPAYLSRKAVSAVALGTLDSCQGQWLPSCGAWLLHRGFYANTPSPDPRSRSPGWGVTLTSCLSVRLSSLGKQNSFTIPMPRGPQRGPLWNPGSDWICNQAALAQKKPFPMKEETLSLFQPTGPWGFGEVGGAEKNPGAYPGPVRSHEEASPTEHSPRAGGGHPPPKA